jgi:glycosyltransferase involved in cell wall biosynthesis
LNEAARVLGVQRRLLVAIPCLNEAQTVADVIGRVPRSIEGVEHVDVLVVDDGSTDETAEIARANGVVVVSHSMNRGVGRAFQSAVDYAIEHGYDMMVNIDGDGQFDPSDIPRLAAPLCSGRADMSTASRFLDPSLTPEMPKVKLVGNRMMSWLISRLVRLRFYDVSCGFRCYTREALLRINIQGAFTYTQETFLDFSVKKMRIVEIPLQVRYFDDRRSRVASSTFRYALNSGKIILRGYRDYYPLRFFWSIAAGFAIPGLVLALLFFGHFLQTGMFTGFLFAGLLSGFLLLLAALFMLIGVVADMLDRIRSNQEKILYIMKKHGH